MKYSTDVIEAIVREKQNERIRRDAETDARRREVYSLIPRVAEIDSELSSSAFDIIRASFGKEESAADILMKRRDKNAALLSEREKLLTDAGYPADVTEIKYDCDICNDSGYDGGVLCRCMHERYSLALAKKINAHLNIPAVSFSDFSLDVYPEKGQGKISPREQMREVLTFARSFSEDFKTGDSLFLNGDSGLGKSFLASCIAKEVSDKGFSVIYDTAYTILGALEDVKFGRRDVNLDALTTCDLLIIDDVGCEVQTPFTTAALYNLINARLSSSLSTIVVSSLKRPEISARYGQQTASRLEGSFIKLEFLGNDVRLMR